jgi:SAM-dependent methyltransferase
MRRQDSLLQDETTGRAVAERRSGPLARLVDRLRRRHDLARAPHGAAALALPDAATVRQWLWGTGFVVPGDAQHVLGLVRPFGLASSMTMLDVAAGLGGPARAVAEATGATVVGLERAPDLARQGMALALALRMHRRAPVGVYDPEGFDLPHAHYDCALGREATYAVRDKERFLRVLMQGLKPQGAIVLTEFVLGRSADRRRLAAWAPLAAYPPFLWTLDRYEDCLRSLGFEPFIMSDISAAYRGMIIGGWTRLLQLPELHGLPRAHFAPIIDEAERAMRTIEALDAGLLRMVHIAAVARRG